MFAIGVLALFGRIVVVGSERIFLKKLNAYDSSVISSLFFLVGAVLLSPLFFFIPSEAFMLSMGEIGWALLSAFIYSFGFFAYVKALAEEDASLIAPLYNSSLLWLLLLAYFFLQENVNAFRISGGITMFVGVFFLYPGSIETKINSIKASRASLYMIIGSLFIAIGRTIDTYVITTTDERIYAVLLYIFIGIFLMISAVIRRQMGQVTKVFKEEPRNLMLAGLANGWGYLLLLIAISFLEVTIAEPATLLSVFVTAALAKKFLGEEVKERLPGMVLMVVGAFFLFL